MSSAPAPVAAPIAAPASAPVALLPPAAPVAAPAIPAAPPAARPAAAIATTPIPLALAAPVDTAPVAVAPAESPAAAPPELPPESGALELVGGDGNMSNGYGHARLMSLRGMAVTSLGVVQGELTQQSRFGYSGNYGSVSLTHDFTPDYYSTVSVGTGNSPLFSSWRVDGTGYRKFGSELQYVAGIGGYYAKGNESARSDQGLLLTGIAYLPGTVIEGGVRLNWADPGRILGPSEYIAATFGNDDRRAVIVRYEHAKETYKVLPGGPELVNFKSNTVNLQWRERISRISMLLAGLEYYRSPAYDRLSFNLGWRWSFR
jgi:YaiO family outer membrane protein